MEKNFEGKQFMIPSIPGRKEPKIDCMFFPATHGDVIELDPILEPSAFNQSSLLLESVRKYIDKPTVIMCNPNALIY
jgi:hypothetical protein